MIDFDQFEHAVLLVGLGMSETANFQAILPQSGYAKFSYRATVAARSCKLLGSESSPKNKKRDYEPRL